MIIPAFICDAIRTPFGRRGGALAAVRPDDLGAIPLMALLERNAGVDWESVDDIYFGCAGQAGEDNRNVARMCALLAGLPAGVPAATLNRLSASGLDAVACAARAIRSGEAGLLIAGGVESVSRAPFALRKAEAAFSRQAGIEDTEAPWPFANRLVERQFGAESESQAAENLAREFGIGRTEQDRFAQASRDKAAAAQREGWMDAEIAPVTVPGGDSGRELVTADEQLRPLAAAPAEDIDAAGNLCGRHDGACAVLLACERVAAKYSLLPRARILAAATAGVPPRIMGMGAAPAARRALVQAGLAMEQMDVIELHEGSAAAALAVLRDWGLADDDARVNPHGGALAIGHAPGASGARMAMAAAGRLHRIKGRYALCAICAEGGQGLAVVLERV